MKLTQQDIARIRLHAQQLDGTSSFTSAQQLVRYFAAVQGQEYAQTKWGIGLRLPHLDDAAIEKELTDGHVLRTHVLRPTWHIIAADDIRWLLQLSAPRVHAASAYMYKKEKLDAALFKRTHQLIRKLLEGNNHLTRDEIKVVLQKNKIAAADHRLSYIMMNAELEGVICSGAKRGKQFTYALLEERAKPVKPFTREQALQELSQRYITSRGPATVNDFAAWSGLTLTDCRKGLEGLSTGFSEHEVDGKIYYAQKNAFKQTAPVKELFLLPPYDELVMGYKDRSAMLQLKKHLPAAPNIPFDNMMMHDGQIVGTWKRVIGSKAIELSYQFFIPKTKTLSLALTKAITRFETFNGLPVHPKQV